MLARLSQISRKKEIQANFLPVPVVGIFFYVFVSFVYCMETFYFFLSNSPSLLPSVINEVIKILDECTS